MDALDGNAIAGWLFEHFGSEMTNVTGRCKNCGTRSLIAELAVYTRAPGAVARCRTCGHVAFVLVNIRCATELHVEAFELTAQA
jgi:ribosomal protein L37E